MENIGKVIGFYNVSGHTLYSELGEYYRRTQQQQKAIEAYQRALEIMHKVEEKPDPQSFAVLYARLMAFYYAQEDYENADINFYKSLQALNYSTQKPQQLSQVINFSILNFIFRARTDLYQVLYDKTKQPQLLDTLAHLHGLVLSLDDYMYKNSSANNQYVNGYTSYVYPSAIKTLLEQNDNNQEKAFLLAEKAQSRLLLENMQFAKVDNLTNIPKTLLNKENQLTADITRLEKLLYTEQNKISAKKENQIRNYQDSLFVLRRKKEELIEKLKNDFPQYHQLKYDYDLVDVKAIQSKLKPDEAVIEYFIGEDYIVTQGQQLQLFIFLISPDNFLVESVPIDFSLTENIQQMRKSIYSYWTLPGQPDSTFIKNNEIFAKTASLLYQKLITPIANHLPRKLLIIPDGILHLLPFDALIVAPAANPNNLQEHHYLLQDHIVSYDYSATMHWHPNNSELRYPKKFIGSFAPSFISEENHLASRNRAIEDIRGDLRPLKYNEVEVSRLQKIAPSEIYNDTLASKNIFINQASQYRILHLATHGKANDQTGDFSFIAFSSDGDSIVENERLYVGELYNLDLNADLVVLSACETGLGELRRGEGLISISRGFHYAGAKSTLTTLWSIQDHPTTVDFMESFYQKLKEGLPKDEALYASKLETLKNTTTAAPYFWAAFIPIGDMSSIPFPGSTTTWWYWSIGIIAIGLISFLLLKSRSH